MTRQRLTQDITRTTFYYNSRYSSRKGIFTADTVDEPASLKVTKRRKKKVLADRSIKSDLHLPTDLIVEILKRLPVRTLARFLCVSKLWGSIICSCNFKKLFLAESSNRPGRLFFTIKRRDDVRILFSSLETGEPFVANYHMLHMTYLPHDNQVKPLSSVHDLICYVNSSSEIVLYNSTTKRSITLPKLKVDTIIKQFIGYDPIDVVYKILCISVTGRRLVSKVLTLGNEYEWRVIESHFHFHVPSNSQICTNGVLYYDAYTNVESKEVAVMSFDVRSEKFDLIKGPVGTDFLLKGFSTLTSYEGKLAMIPSQVSANGSMVLWVLESAQKHEWLKKTFVLPQYWTSLAQDALIPSLPHELRFFFNINVAGEFILAPLVTYAPPFYVLYYDPKRDNIRKVPIEGIIEHELLQGSTKLPWSVSNLCFSQVESFTLW